MSITVLTPTYNRAHLLTRLYNSLKSQINTNFEWVIIDDGSNDNTKEIVDSFIKENIIIIRYFFKNNGGKHTAINYGVGKIDSKYTFIVDSDDWLTSDAIDNIYNASIIYIDENICGFSFLRMYPDGKINISLNNDKPKILSYYEGRILNGKIGDMAEVFATKYLKRFPFPEFENEKFIGEDIVWMEMSKEYKLVFLNKPIYYSDYLEDGLTKNRRINNIHSPKGCYLRAKVFLEFNLPLKVKVKSIIQLIVYGKFANKTLRSIVKDSNHFILFSILLVPSLFLYLRWRNKLL